MDKIFESFKEARDLLNEANEPVNESFYHGYGGNSGRRGSMYSSKGGDGIRRTSDGEIDYNYYDSFGGGDEELAELLRRHPEVAKEAALKHADRVPYEGTNISQYMLDVAVNDEYIPPSLDEAFDDKNSKILEQKYRSWWSLLKIGISQGHKPTLDWMIRNERAFSFQPKSANVFNSNINAFDAMPAEYLEKFAKIYLKRNPEGRFLLDAKWCQSMYLTYRVNVGNIFYHVVRAASSDLRNRAINSWLTVPKAQRFVKILLAFRAKPTEEAKQNALPEYVSLLK